MKKILPALALTLTLAACNPTTTTDNTQHSSQPTAKRAAVEWSATQSGAGNDTMPVATIMLKVASTGEELYRTDCNGAPSTEMQPIEGSIASIQCWWAGGGDQYAVFVGDAEKLTVRHRTVDEETGYGAWEDVSSF